MEKAMMIKIYMYHMSDSIISKHNVYLNFCLSLFSWHEDHKESIINVQYLYVTHMSIPSLLSLNRVEYWKKLSTTFKLKIFIIPNDLTRNHVKLVQFVPQKKKIS